MISFTELLTASDDQLVKIFYKIKVDANDDFIKRINKIAAQLGLNHAQLVCAIGFNKNIRDLTDIISVLGFRDYKLMSYRQNELFTTDTYQQLAIDNILDIYSARLEDVQIMESLRELLIPRLELIEADIEKTRIRRISSVTEWKYMLSIRRALPTKSLQNNVLTRTLASTA